MRQIDYCEECLTSRMVEIGLTEPISWPNLPFDKPDTSKVWLAFHYVPNDPVPVTAGDNGLDEIRGFVQVDINLPIGSGNSEAKRIFNLITRYFPSGVAIRHETGWVKPTSIGRTSGVEVDGWFRYHITINWYSRISRGL